MERRSLTDFGPLLFVIALFYALLVAALFQDGMFKDGILYAAVSRNYAEGYGSFWNMHFSETYFPQFHEQPPLMFFLEGMFFKVLGNSIYTERIYSLIVALITVSLIVRCWKLIAPREKTGARTAWLPLLLWVLLPISFHMYTNNLEECTLTLFSMLAFYSVLKAILKSPEKNFHWFIAGIWILAAGLTKGLQGMFLLSAPFWCWIILRNGSFRQFLYRTLLIGSIPLAFAVIAWLTPVIHDSLVAYYDARLSETLTGESASTTHRFHLLWELFIDTLLPVAVVLIFALGGRKLPAFRSELQTNRRLIFFIFACGFSGILPLMITLEQRGFYLNTAAPLLALGAAVIVKPIVVQFSRYIGSRKWLATGITAFAITALAAGITFTFINAGTPKCDADKIAAVHEVAAIMGDDMLLGVDQSLSDDWSLMNYFQRHHHVSLTHEGDGRTKWVLVPKGGIVRAGYLSISLNSTIYELYQKPDSLRFQHGDGLVH